MLRATRENEGNESIITMFRLNVKDILRERIRWSGFRVTSASASGKNISLPYKARVATIATLVFRHLERIELDGWSLSWKQRSSRRVGVRETERESGIFGYINEICHFLLSFSILRIERREDGRFSRFHRENRMILESLPSRNSSVTRRLFGVRGSRGRRSPMPCAFSSPEARTVGERHRPWDVEKERCQGREGGGGGGGIAYHLSPCA